MGAEGGSGAHRHLFLFRLPIPCPLPPPPTPIGGRAPILRAQACLGPIILLGTHENVVISFKIRRKKMNFKIEANVLTYDVNNIFVFMPTK